MTRQNAQQLTPATALNGELIEKRWRELQTPLNLKAEVGFALQILKANSTILAAANENPHSLQAAVVNVAAIGLSLNPAKKEAYLIKRDIKISQNQWLSTVCLEPSYMGLCNLATSSGRVSYIVADVVYQNDEFIDNGIGEKPEHKRDPFSNDRGDFVGTYCTAKLDSGEYLTTIMTAEEIYSIRDRSEAYKRAKKGPWVTDFVQMAKKSVVRNAFKMWPKTGDFERMEQAVHISNENEGFEPLMIDTENRQATGAELSTFQELFSGNNPLKFMIFWVALDYGAQTSIYNSFPQGEKTAGKNRVTELLSHGRDLLTATIEAITEHIANQDATGALEELEPYNTDELEFIFTDLEPQAVSFCKAAINESLPI